MDRIGGEIDLWLYPSLAKSYNMFDGYFYFDKVDESNVNDIALFLREHPDYVLMRFDDEEAKWTIKKIQRLKAI